MNEQPNKAVDHVRMSYIKRATLNLIDWPDYKKAQLIYFVSAGLGLYAAILLTISWEWLDIRMGNTINTRMWFQASFLAVLYSLCNLLLAFYGKRFAKTEPYSPLWYWRSSMLMFTIGNVIALIYVGTFSLSAGSAMSGGPVIGMLLFNKKDALIPLLIGCSIAFAWYAITYSGVIEYAMILENSDFRHKHPAWLLLCLGVSIPQIISIVYVAWVCVERWKLREQEMLHLSRTDPLTQISNRRHFIATLEESVADNQQNPHPISLLMMDLDHFKNINDTHTHQVGDFVLVELAHEIKRRLPDNCSFFRYGGEEFCILMSDYTSQEVHILANALRQTIESHIFEYTHRNENLRLHITTSIGVCCHAAAEPTLTSSEILNKADGALYAAKRNGRNKVFCCDDGDITQYQTPQNPTPAEVAPA